MKKLFSILFALTCAVGIFAHDCVVDGIYYNLNKTNMSAIVTYKGKDYLKNRDRYVGAVNIPEQIVVGKKTYSVTTIGEDAFFMCDGLTSVTIPNSVTTIGHGAFASCDSLTTINLDAANTRYCLIDGVLFNYAKDTLIQYPNGSDRTEYSIPNSVTTIGEYAFDDCKGLTSITIPNSVTEISGWATFGFCRLSSITILNPKVKIQNEAFYKSTITDLYCGERVDLSQVKGTIKNVHRFNDEELSCLLPFDEYARKYVESRINRWQKKGDYEKTSDWQKRVNETTRKQKVNEYVKEAEKKYLAGYAKRQNYKFTLGKYDPDNEVFLVKEDKWGDLLVSVPIADAQYVGKNWSLRTTIPHYVFAGTEVVLQSVDFTFPNNKKYTYKPNQQLTYSTPDIKYNFNPIELPDLQTVTMGGATQVSQTPQAAQYISSVTITTPVDLTPMSSVLVSYKNIFGKYEMPDLDVTFPYVVIRVKLQGTPNLIRLAKQSLSLDLGQSFIVEQTVPQDDKILFLVPTGVKNIYLTDGNGQRQLLYSGRLQPNTIYDGTVEVK